MARCVGRRDSISCAMLTTSADVHSSAAHGVEGGQGEVARSRIMMMSIQRDDDPVRACNDNGDRDDSDEDTKVKGAHHLTRMFRKRTKGREE
jgi:hypothetical protein